MQAQGEHSDTVQKGPSWVAGSNPKPFSIHFISK